MGNTVSHHAGGLAAALLLGLPLIITTAWLFHRFVIVRAPGPKARRLAILDGLLCTSILPFLYVTLSQGYGSGRTFSLIPFAELSDSFSNTQVAFSEVTLLNIGGNMALLFFFGALLPLRNQWFDSLGRVVIVAAMTSAGVEILQFLMATGRVSSTDDVLINVAGALLGALSTRPWWPSRRPARKTTRVSTPAP